jgi:hypothetical protein
MNDDHGCVVASICRFDLRLLVIFVLSGPSSAVAPEPTRRHEGHTDGHWRTEDDPGKDGAVWTFS